MPPIEQKRMVAFINNFIVNTVTFLNEFMANVESKFIEFESKLQTIELSLQIVEAKVFINHHIILNRCECPFEIVKTYQMTFQMASIPDVGDNNNQSKPSTSKNESQMPTTATAVKPSSSNTIDKNDSKKFTETTIENEPEPTESLDVPDNTVGVKACEDARYRKFFKMVQFGVPPPAVKLKMNAEGVDPNVLE